MTAKNLLVLKLLIITINSQASDDPVTCGSGIEANNLAELIIQHPKQERLNLTCDQSLTEIAQLRAEQLGTNTADPKITPNQYLIQSGYRVPNYYPVTGNQVEATVAKFSQADEVIKYLTQNFKHKEHILGVGEFFGLQTQLGIGFFEATEITEKNQWVVLTAEKWQLPKIVFKQHKPEGEIKFIDDSCDSDWKNSSDEMLKANCSSFKHGRTKVKRKGKGK